MYTGLKIENHKLLTLITPLLFLYASFLPSKILKIKHDKEKDILLKTIDLYF